MSESLSRRRNIGKTVAARLQDIGITTVEDLRSVGPAAAYRLLSALNPGRRLPKCYYLFSLQGALDDVHWDELSPDVKRRLERDAGIEPSSH